MLALPEGTRYQVLAPVVRGRKGEYQDLFDELKQQGFARARVDGELVELSEPPVLEKKLKHTIEVVVDRLVARDGVRSRLADPIETALEAADGLVIIDPVDGDMEPRRYSERRACPNDHALALEEIEPRTFSFNAPYGACPECHGLGVRLEVDPGLVVPDPSLTLREGALAPWARRRRSTSARMLARAREGHGVPDGRAVLGASTRRRRTPSCTARTTRSTSASGTATGASASTRRDSRA